MLLGVTRALLGNLFMLQGLRTLRVFLVVPFGCRPTQCVVPPVCPRVFFPGILFFPGNPRLVFPQKIVPLFLLAAGTLDYFFIVYRLHIRIPHDFLMKNEWSFGLLEWLTFSAP